jgi:hypothetical protein
MTGTRRWSANVLSYPGFVQRKGKSLLLPPSGLNVCPMGPSLFQEMANDAIQGDATTKPKRHAYSTTKEEHANCNYNNH